MKTIYWVFGALALLILGVGAWYGIKSMGLGGPKPAIVLPGDGFTEHTEYYDITAAYATSTPLVASAGALADAEARSIILGFIRDTVDTFKNNGNFESLTKEDKEMIGFSDERKYRLQLTYKEITAAKTISYVYTIYEDTLGAHGNTSFRTFTFNRTSGAALALGDVFSSPSYLTTLSSISRKRLPAMLGDFADSSMIEAGTSPQALNFQNFYFEGRDLVLLFAPYQVAAYAAGPQTLRIPRTELGAALKAEYR